MRWRRAAGKSTSDLARIDLRTGSRLFGLEHGLSFVNRCARLVSSKRLIPIDSAPPRMAPNVH
jgi:hypothetical protein